MTKLSTIQKRNNLNDIYRYDEKGPGGGYHDYDIYSAGEEPGLCDPIACVSFQCGPRNNPESRHGVLANDLLEIVRDQFASFQAGELRNRETACALTHVEEALMWLNKRAEDRVERRVLGTMEA